MLEEKNFDSETYRRMKKSLICFLIKMEKINSKFNYIYMNLTTKNIFYLLFS
jgi:hypothetical protein